jgi:hypothetical protein
MSELFFSLNTQKNKALKQDESKKIRSKTGRLYEKPEE